MVAVRAHTLIAPVKPAHNEGTCGRGLCGAECEGRADVAAGVRLSEGCGDSVLGSPSGAVAGYDEIGSEIGQFGDRFRNDGFEQAAREVESSDESVDVINAGHALRVAQDVDRPRVTAARENNYALASHEEHHGLVVPRPWVGLPRSSDVRLLDRKPLLKVGDTVDLAGYQNGVVQQERGASLVDDLPPSRSRSLWSGGGSRTSRPVGKTIFRCRHACG